MGRTKSIPQEGAVSLRDAFVNGDEAELTRAAVLKYAEVIDVTESGRDMKPLITGMFEALDRLKALEASTAARNETPLVRVLSMDTELKAVACG